jgi:hypothetical protein
VVSNVDDYAHWSWMHPGNSSANSTNNCAYASNLYQYDYFNGDNQNVSQTSAPSFFQTVSADLKNGWTATGCGALYAYVCMMPSSVYGCGPPPSPPPPPPSPPVPPSPPLPLSCERRSAAEYRRHAQSVTAGSSSLFLCVAADILPVCTSSHPHQRSTCVPPGAPVANRTFFCDPGDFNCYSLVATKMEYANASTFCEGMSGQLVAYTSREKQLLVEQYLR